MKCLDYILLIKVNCVTELLNKNLKHRGEKNVYLQKPVCYLSISFKIMFKKKKEEEEWQQSPPILLSLLPWQYIVLEYI